MTSRESARLEYVCKLQAPVPKRQRVCYICGQSGHCTNNQKFHPLLDELDGESSCDKYKEIENVLVQDKDDKEGKEQIHSIDF